MTNAPGEIDLQLPDGSKCISHWECASEWCADGYCDRDASRLDSVLECDVPRLGSSELQVLFRATTSRTWTPNAKVEVRFAADVRIPAAIAQTVIDEGSDRLDLEEISIEVRIEGGTPSSALITSEQLVTSDVDVDNDGVAEDVFIKMPSLSVDITHDGTSSAIDLSIVRLEVAFGEGASFGEVVMSEAAERSDFDCSLASQTQSFAIGEPLDDGSRCISDSDCASGRCAYGACQATGPNDITASLFCVSGIPFAPFEADFKIWLTVLPRGNWSRQRSVEVAFDATVIIPKRILELMVSEGGLEVHEIVVDLQVEGGAPSTLQLKHGAATFDIFEAGGDVAEEIAVVLPRSSFSVASNTAAAVRFSVSRVALSVANAPLLGAVTLSDGTEESIAPCERSTTVAVFPVTDP